MASHRRTWTERIPRAFAEASSVNGDRLRPRDVVEVLARDLQDTDRRRIAENVSKYVRRDSDGIYRLSRPGSVHPHPPNAGDPAPLRTPALASHDFLAEIRRANVDETLKAINEALRTCHGQYCDRLDKLKAQLTALETSLGEKVKAAVDSRSVLFDERLIAIEAAVAGIPVPPPLQTTSNAVTPTTVEVEIPEDRVFVCPKCGDALVIGQPECPNDTCEQVIDWDPVFTPEYLQGIEKELEAAKDAGPGKVANRLKLASRERVDS